MFAVRSLRMATGVTIDGTFYSHQAWTLVPVITPALEAARTPGEKMQRIPLVEIVDVDSDGDPISDTYFEVANGDAPPAEAPTDGLDAMVIKDIVALAKEHGLNPVGKKKAELIVLLREKLAAAPPAEDDGEDGQDDGGKGDDGAGE